MTVEMTISARIAQTVEKAMTRKASERGQKVAAASLADARSDRPIGRFAHASGSRMR